MSPLRRASRQFIEAAPRLLGNLAPVWETWRAVNGQRSGSGAIRISEVRAYLDEEGIVRDAERRRHFEAVRILDAEQLRLIEEDRRTDDMRARHVRRR